MNSQAGFIFKVLLLSTGLSIAIKYGGRYLPLEPNNLLAASVVCLPSLLIGLILGWQYWKSTSIN